MSSCPNMEVKLVNKTGKGVVLDIVLGIVGALVGGFLFNLFVAVVGAVLLVVAYHVIRRRNLAWYRR